MTISAELWFNVVAPITLVTIGLIAVVAQGIVTRRNFPDHPPKPPTPPAE